MCSLFVQSLIDLLLQNPGEKTMFQNSTVEVCNFCGKHPQEVSVLLKGPSVSICNECINTCLEILVDWPDVIFPSSCLPRHAGLDDMSIDDLLSPLSPPETRTLKHLFTAYTERRLALIKEKENEKEAAEKHKKEERQRREREEQKHQEALQQEADKKRQLSEELSLLKHIADRHQIRLIDPLDDHEIDPRAIGEIPRKLCEEFTLIPYGYSGRGRQRLLRIAMTDVFWPTINRLTQHLGAAKKFVPVLAQRESILQAIHRYYRS